MNSLYNFYIHLNSLTIFHSLLEHPVIVKLQQLFSDINEPTAAIKAYTSFTAELYKHTDNFSDFIYNFVLEEETFYMKSKAMGLEVSPLIEDCLSHELLLLTSLSALSSKEVKAAISYDGFLPDWSNTEYDLTSAYRDRINGLARFGYGIYTRYHMFTLSGNDIVPIKCPDSQTLEQLSGYDRERGLVLKNTQNLLEGNLASNILLYGDAGTGKSSTVKAIVNHYKDQGLRLVEIKKHQLYQLPDLLETLASNPLKFIIFIDDLSFMENDDNFSALKAILEGSAFARSSNVVIYATSNRRHLVKERSSDRSTDEMHLNDTLQEIMSLAARFGLTITFQKPDKDTYLQIVRHLAKEYGLDPNDEHLAVRAEAFAIRNNGRSPRTAKNFVEQQKSGL